MSLSDKVLEELKVTRADLKHYLETHSRTCDFATRAQAFINADGYGNIYNSPTCCGAKEIGGMEESNYPSKRARVLSGILSGHRCLLYYSVTKSDTEHFLSIGFKHAGFFSNPNTKRKVEILTLTLPWNTMGAE